MFLKESFYRIGYLLACGQNFCTGMKYKALCYDYDTDISRRFVSCQCMRKVVYDRFHVLHEKFVLGVHTFLIVLNFCI